MLTITWSDRGVTAPILRSPPLRATPYGHGAGGAPRQAQVVSAGVAALTRSCGRNGRNAILPAGMASQRSREGVARLGGLAFRPPVAGGRSASLAGMPAGMHSCRQECHFLPGGMVSHSSREEWPAIPPGSKLQASAHSLASISKQGVMGRRQPRREGPCPQHTTVHRCTLLQHMRCPGVH